MKALILAAGIGSRLKPLTNSIPKSLIKINGKPILFKQIDNLIANGIEEITIVSGYLSNVLEKAVHENYSNVKIIRNSDYLSTNNMYSAYLAKALFNDSLLMMNADVFFDSCIIHDLLSSEYDNVIMIDIGKYIEESMKVTYNEKRITSISKQIKQKDSFGTSIDIYKFSKNGAAFFIKKCQDYIEKDNNCCLWSEVALNDILSEVDFYPCKVKGQWCEIDTAEDLFIANKMFREKND